MDLAADLAALAHIGLAASIGAAIGFEREIADKPAGLRTHMLVGAAAALLVILAERSVLLLAAHVPGVDIQADPIRVIQTVVLGISFLGAGTIFVRRGTGRVAGLTTAASILMTAALGLAVGLGAIVLALGVAVLVIAVLTVVGRVESHLHRAQTQDAAGRPVDRVMNAVPRGA
jgi:putative Mg2+ transporter-C (MgtC) family protein